MKIPSPGSDEAVRQGCVCPVMDNHQGKGYMGIPGIFVYSGSCHLHALRNRVEHKSKASRSLQWRQDCQEKRLCTRCGAKLEEAEKRKDCHFCRAKRAQRRKDKLNTQNQ